MEICGYFIKSDHLVTEIGLYDRKAFYKVKHYFYLLVNDDS